MVAEGEGVMGFGVASAPLVPPMAGGRPDEEGESEKECMVLETVGTDPAVEAEGLKTSAGALPADFFLSKSEMEGRLSGMGTG